MSAAAESCPTALDSCPTAWPRSDGKMSVEAMSSRYAFQPWLVAQGEQAAIADCQSTLCYYSRWLGKGV